ncbi:TPA: DUF551 domain-containing protein [Escherichia coli]|nr:hypothetical protein HMPREF9533_01624 [Escherichia coli MS 60-1]EIN5053692.1 DUF551 domain-containing protein [Escherichia coli]EIU8583117.1 DUF551 domain-containing protein [Escherichia coli]HBB7388167.1 DUF551 domain-containing protein [Escherichia coli]HBI8523026.1 DUF551 domain-containing protein [Escherichia coli]
MTTFTNSKLTDEYVSNATLIRLILWADQHNSHYVVAALRELQERRKADSVPVEINDDMAYAFHHALSDSSPGADEVEEIKAGVRAAFANVTTQPAPVVPEFETWFNSQESGRSICSTQIRRSLQEISWNACCAAMLQGKSEQPQNAQQNIPENIPGGNSPVTPDGWISCSERMPNDKQYVWCWGKSYGWTECNTFEGYYDWSRNKWWAVTDIGEEPASKVTHWMPLPEPPQEVK